MSGYQEAPSYSCSVAFKGIGFSLGRSRPAHLLSTHRLYCAGIERRCFVYFDGVGGGGGGWLGEGEEGS